MKWSLRFYVARYMHSVVNKLAWRFAVPSGPAWGRALRIDRTHPLWRLNDRLAEGWIDEYMERYYRRGGG